MKRWYITTSGSQSKQVVNADHYEYNDVAKTYQFYEAKGDVIPVAEFAQIAVVMIVQEQPIAARKPIELQTT